MLSGGLGLSSGFGCSSGLNGATVLCSTIRFCLSRQGFVQLVLIVALLLGCHCGKLCIFGVDLLIGQPSIGQAHTTEKDLRAAPDRQIECALVAFFWSVDAARAARARHAPEGEIFALRHTVSKSDL